MKKLLLAGVGMAGLLAGCASVSVAFEPVTLNSVQFTSNWTFVDANGQTQHIICDDRETTVFIDVRWTGPLARLDARFEGKNTTINNTTRTTGNFTPDYSGARQFTYTFGPGMAPQSLTKSESGSLSAQAIVVNPVNRGTTFLTVTGYNPDGLPSNTVQVPQGIPVYTCGA